MKLHDLQEARHISNTLIQKIYALKDQVHYEDDHPYIEVKGNPHHILDQIISHFGEPKTSFEGRIFDWRDRNLFPDDPPAKGEYSMSVAFPWQEGQGTSIHVSWYK